MSSDEIFFNESHWRNMNENQLDEYVEKIFNYYRSTGFPFYRTDYKYRFDEYHKLRNYDYENIIKDDVVQQSMHGLGLAWSFFPHAFEVKCSNKMSPMDAFSNDEIFRKVIKKRLQMGTYMSDSGIMKMLRLYTGVQAVSNFRPTAAAAIYDKYAWHGKVWDMSAGWGGRLFGAARSTVHKYIGTDPSIATYYSLIDIKYFLLQTMDLNMDIVLYSEGSEDYIPEKESLDLCFTSPPYFDLEKYANEPTQSFLKYPEKNMWVEGFLRKTFQNCHHGLKKNGHMAINIADPKKKKDISLESETIRVAKECGFKHTETLKLALSNPVMSNKQSAFKYEPIFVFQK